MKENKNKLFRSIEVDLENGCGYVESLKMNGVEEKNYKEVLIGLKKWEVEEFGESMEDDLGEFEECDVKLLKSIV
tara:strand:- start:412 stop:636 length:225 start_codon:yes stop_codon:yes gene_type:complete